MQVYREDGNSVCSKGDGVMAEIKWIKISTDVFDNRKIKQIESMPDGDSIIVIWFKILTLAGTVNDAGQVYFTKDIPYTDQMLATSFGRPISTIQFALHIFEDFGMIEVVDDIIHVTNWEKYQNVDGMEKIREQTKERVARHRERKRLECNVTGNVTVTQCNATDIEEDIDKEIDIDKEKKIKDKTISPEPAASEPVIASLILQDGTVYKVTQSEADKYKDLYRNVNVEQELRHMQGWCDKNPAKRKTSRGIGKFITTWLSKADKEHTGPETPSAGFGGWE